MFLKNAKFIAYAKTVYENFLLINLPKLLSNLLFGRIPFRARYKLRASVCRGQLEETRRRSLELLCSTDTGRNRGTDVRDSDNSARRLWQPSSWLGWAGSLFCSWTCTSRHQKTWTAACTLTPCTHEAMRLPTRKLARIKILLTFGSTDHNLVDRLCDVGFNHECLLDLIAVTD